MPEGVKAGHPVFWRTFGDGPDHALLLHCALAYSKIWSRVAVGLSDYLSMIAPDMPGHGRSGAWDVQRDIFDLVTDIALDCLGEGGHLIGHSFGAVVALRVATIAPEKVRSLTLIEPVFFAAARLSQPEVLAQYLDEEAAFSKALRVGDFETGAREFTRVWGDGRPWSSLSAAERDAFEGQMHFIRDTEATLMQDTAGLLDAERLKRITCPTYCLRGADTNPVIAAIHEALVGRIPEARDHVVPGAGHMLPLTDPDAVAAHVRSVLDMQDGGYHLQHGGRCAI